MLFGQMEQEDNEQAIYNVDCLIIGAGPTGLTLGIGLLMQGRTVIISDKHEKGQTFSRALLINSQALQSLQGLGVTPKLRKAGTPVNGVSLYVYDHLVSSANFDIDHASNDHPIILEQQLTESCLCDRFAELGGKVLHSYAFDENNCVRTQTGFSVKLNRTALDQDEPNQPDFKMDTSESSNSKQITVHCRLLFGCDGVRSSVRKFKNIIFSGCSQKEPNYLKDIALNDWPFRTDINFWFTAEGTGLAVRLSKNPIIVRIIGSTKTICENIRTKLHEEEVLYDGEWTPAYHIAQSYGSDNVWFAGDAAHEHTPLGGRGMNIGIVEAVTLAKACKDNSFNDYERQCLPVARHWVRLNYLLSRIAMGQAHIYYIIRVILCVMFMLLGWLLEYKLAKSYLQFITGTKIKC